MLLQKVIDFRMITVVILANGKDLALAVQESSFAIAVNV